MNTAVSRRDDCRLCRGKALELVLQLAPTPIADDYVSEDRLGEIQETYPLDLFLCRSCGHVQLSHVINPEVLFRQYLYTTSVSLGLVEHFRRSAEELMGHMNPGTGSLVVDIGSNDGTFLRFFRERGMRVLGIDPAREIAREATCKGIETLPAYFTSKLGETIRKKYGPAAIVAANNVFAHADDLADMADGIGELLVDDGVFVFEVSYVVDLVQKFLFDTVYHEHLCYHSVGPLKSFFTRHGLQLIDVQRISTKGGSLRGNVQLAGGPRPVSVSVPELIALEQEHGFDGSVPFAALGRRLAALKKQLRNLLTDLKSRGKKIVGYGASATVTTLVYGLDLGDQLDFIVDDNPGKHGRFSPGYHIPVLPSEAIYDRKVDYIVILAWAYADAIMKKHQAFLDKGGRFIVPVPEVSVI